MRVIITAMSVESTDLFVEFRSSSGVGFAKWDSGFGPSAGQVLDVEIDIDDAICIGSNADLHGEHAFGISHDGKSLSLRGFIEDQDEDGLAYFRISTDCLIMVESVETNLAGRWVELEVPVSSVKIIPIGGVNL